MSAVAPDVLSRAVWIRTMLSPRGAQATSPVEEHFDAAGAGSFTGQAPRALSARFVRVLAMSARLYEWQASDRREWAPRRCLVGGAIPSMLLRRRGCC